MVEGTQKQFARTSHLAPRTLVEGTKELCSHLAPWWKGPRNFARTSHLGGRDQRTLLAPRTLVEGTKELCSHLAPCTLVEGTKELCLHLAPWWKGPKNFACTSHLGGRDQRTGMLWPKLYFFGNGRHRSLWQPP